MGMGTSSVFVFASVLYCICICICICIWICILTNWRKSPCHQPPRSWPCQGNPSFTLSWTSVADFHKHWSEIVSRILSGKLTALKRQLRNVKTREFLSKPHHPIQQYLSDVDMWEMWPPWLIIFCFHGQLDKCLLHSLTTWWSADKCLTTQHLIYVAASVQA